MDEKVGIKLVFNNYYEFTIYREMEGDLKKSQKRPNLEDLASDKQWLSKSFLKKPAGKVKYLI